MMSAERLGDILPVKRDSHTEPLFAPTTMRWMGHSRYRPDFKASFVCFPGIIACERS
jgi:hypothetical protein